MYTPLFIAVVKHLLEDTQRSTLIAAYALATGNGIWQSIEMLYQTENCNNVLNEQDITVAPTVGDNIYWKIKNNLPDFKCE